MLEQVIITLRSWGGSDNQIKQFVESDTAGQKAVHVSAIEECFELLYREPKQKQRFLTRTNKGMFFEGRKPLDVILSEDLDQVSEAHRMIRSMICI